MSIRICCTKNRLTSALPFVAGAAATCFANRTYEYPGAVLIGSAIAAITYLASSWHKDTQNSRNLSYITIKRWESTCHSSDPATARPSFDKAIQRMNGEGSLSDDLYQFITEKMTEEHRSPHSFYRFVDKWVESTKHKLNYETAFLILRAYDEERNLVTEATNKMNAYLLKYSAQKESIYLFYQTYRGVKNSRQVYESTLNTIYQSDGDECRVKNLLAYQLARAYSKGHPADELGAALKAKSETLRKNTSVSAERMIPATDQHRYNHTVFIEEGHGEILEEVPRLLENQESSVAVVNMFRAERLEEVELFLVSNLYESLESVSREWKECSVIISPKVTFFQVNEDSPKELFTVDVLSSPNIFNGAKGLKNKIRSMLRAAYHKGYKQLVISGAPDKKIYKDVLEEPEFKNRFAKIICAKEH